MPTNVDEGSNSWSTRSSVEIAPWSQPVVEIAARVPNSTNEQIPDEGTRDGGIVLGERALVWLDRVPATSWGFRKPLSYA